MSQTHFLIHVHLGFSTVSQLFVDRSGRSLQFYHLQFGREAISNDCKSDVGLEF